jgi:membrane protein DedA with SNARE-associated domain
MAARADEAAGHGTDGADVHPCATPCCRSAAGGPEALDAEPTATGAAVAAGPGDDSAATLDGSRVAAEARPAPRLRALALAALLVPQALLVLVQGAAPLLLREAPLLLLALYPFQPWSLLVSARTGPVPFVAVIVAVRTVPCWGGYFAGRWYGVKALDRLSRGRRAGRVTRAVVRVSARAGGLLLVVYPGATASVLAGANAMPLRRFVPLMLTGLLLSAVLTRIIADSASGLVTAVAALVEQYAVPLGLVLLAGVVVTRLVRRRASR